MEPKPAAALPTCRPASLPGASASGHSWDAPPLSELLAHLAGRPRQAGHPRTVVLVAHPDDEVLGIGAHLANLPLAALVHVTAGAPADGRDAALAGFASADEYGRARRGELAAALERAGLAATPSLSLGLADQRVAFDLPWLSRRVAGVLAELGAEVVLTHPYEGGHPDHDAIACAASAAQSLLGAWGARPAALVEMTSYHAGPKGTEWGRFLPAEGCPELVMHLTPEQSRAKAALLDCFVTQREVIRPAPLDSERLRPAPRYDFGRPPHAGELNYERLGLGELTGAGFSELARAARITLGLEGA